MYNRYLNSHFDGCQLLANSYDEYRKRPVQVFLVPGSFDVVGVSDGTDAWIAPVVADPFQVNIKAILESVKNGTFRGATTPTARRRFVPKEGPQADLMNQPVARRTLLAVGTAPEAKTTPTRVRIVNNA